MVDVTIVAVSRTQHGEQVCVSGSGEALGAWALERAVAMTTDEATFPVWSARVAVPAGQAFEFKLLVRPHPTHRAMYALAGDPLFLRWEPPLVGNRLVDGASVRGRALRIECAEWGNVAATRVHVTLDDLLSPASLDRFHRLGYAVFQAAVPPPLVDALRRECAQSQPSSVHLFEDGCIVQPPASQLDGLWRRDPTLRRIYVELARALLGEHSVYLLNEQFVVKMPHLPHTATEFAYHQDQQYLELPPGAPRVLYVSLWTALTDMSEENGTLIVLPYVPGSNDDAAVAAAAASAAAAADADAESSDASEDVMPKRARVAPVEAPFDRIHREAAARYGCDTPPRGDESEGGEFDERETPLLVQAGDIVAMSSLIWHRSNANVSDQTRIAFMPQFSAQPVRLASGITLGVDLTDCDA